MDTRVNDDDILKYLLKSNSENLVLKVQFVSENILIGRDPFTSTVWIHCLYSLSLFEVNFMMIPFSQDVQDYLNKNGGQFIIAEYQTRNTLTESSRRKFVNFLVNMLVERYGLYPKAFEKIMIAKAAIDLFPKFRVDNTEHGTVRKKYIIFVFFLLLIVVLMREIFHLLF